ncbi:hypothetical protein K6119_01180 [Paracrocinitomix mangrovi]|uniref:hypothetical protein n=1 Tax=Paracrocinitomix mangrovi TaxID=2862509 RepID=UPI001C8EA15E|nr:hypothetical protein [Paracrocinitomix mangrovi]UKN02128.1 hypothetical protein K6119_01180 [Paracrocinitomix mangrovi]
MLKHLLLFLIISLASLTNAQKITIYGDVVDVEGDPGVAVRYYFKNNPSKKFKTKVDGKFSIQLDLNEYDTLKFESVQFDPYAEFIGKRSHKRALKNNDSLYIKIVMPDRLQEIFTVRPTVPDTLFGTQEYSVEDYEFMPDGRMILLTYEKTLSKGAILRLLDDEFNEIDKQYVVGEAVELSKDYRGNVHLINEERIYLIKVIENDIRTYLENRDYYFKYIAPIIDTIGDNIYFSNYSDLYPAFDYFEFNLKDSTYKVMLQIEDTLMMELYRSEFKYVDVRTKLWAHQKQIETGIDKEIWVGATVFTNSVYYEPLYAPLFKIDGDSILVFDHYKNKMFKYTPNEGFVDSTRITYHLQSRKSGWEQPLLKDKTNGKVYAMFQKSGYTYLSEIDKYTGQVNKSFKLFFKYVDRIQIIDDQVFYIYRPFESIQKKYVYREKLN